MMLLLAMLAACAVPKDASDTPADTAEAPTVVSGTFVMLDARSGDPREDVTLTSPEQQTTTEGGEGVLDVLTGPFSVTASADDAQDHHMLGMAGEDDFTFISYMSDRTLTGQVMGMLGRSADPAKGFLVVGLDHPDLSPAVGASAEIDASADATFLLGARGPVEGSEITSAVGGFVTFANVTPGPVEITVTPADGERCVLFPAGDADPVTVGVYADAVTIITFHCDADAESD